MIVTYEEITVGMEVMLTNTSQQGKVDMIDMRRLAQSDVNLDINDVCAVKVVPISPNVSLTHPTPPHLEQAVLWLSPNQLTKI